MAMVERRPTVDPSSFPAEYATVRDKKIKVGDRIVVNQGKSSYAGATVTHIEEFDDSGPGIMRWAKRIHFKIDGGVDHAMGEDLADLYIVSRYEPRR